MIDLFEVIHYGEFQKIQIFSQVLKAKSIRGDDIVFKKWARDIDKSIIDEVQNSTNFKDLNLRELHVKNRVTSNMPYNYFVYCIAAIYDNSAYKSLQVLVSMIIL